MSQTCYQSSPYSSAALCALALTTMLSSMSSSIANIGLPALAAFFHASFSQVQWVVLTYLLAVTGSVLAMGWLSDRFGRQRLLAAGVLLFTLASLACGLAGHLGWLIAARLIQGLGGAIMLVNSLALVVQVVPADRSGRAMGVMGSLSALGTAMGPAFGGVLVAAFGWRALFLINLLPGLLLWLLIRHSLLSPKGSASDKAGETAAVTTAKAGSPASVMPADTAAIDRSGATADAGVMPPSPSTAGSKLNPLLRQRALIAGLLLSLVVAAVMMTTMVVGPFYLAAGLHLSPRQSGMLMALGPLVAVATGLPAGQLVDRIGSPRATACSLLAVAAGCGLLTELPQAMGRSGYAIGLMLLTAGYALFQAANNTALLKGADPARRGRVSGMLNLSRNLGFIAGAGLMATVYATAGRDLPAVDAASRGLSVTFGLAAGMVLLALIVVRPWRNSPTA
ncbi:MFS transporter [Erwinia sp. S38]|uniref:MFS transporter n=1 Tax=Erwinia sp. S38 TaxID=2769338 RepID=UPI00190B8690|nr:MFS transporter [Erwinia sp. S38]MBK0004557.1 MFS transporter [Erwinia sp. S38]